MVMSTIGRDAEVIVLSLSLSLLWYSLELMSDRTICPSIVLDSFEHIHLYIYTHMYLSLSLLLTSGQHRNFLLCESNSSFFLSPSNGCVCVCLKKAQEESDWTAFLIEVTVDVSAVQLEIHQIFYALSIIVFPRPIVLCSVLIWWKRVTQCRTIRWKLQRTFLLSRETKAQN